MRYEIKLLATVSLGVLMALPAAPVNATVDEMVVTARKREENIQDVPLSVSAFSGQQLLESNVSKLSDISQYVAGLEFDQSFQRTFERPVIRGKSTILTAAGGVGVSYFVNGVYYEDVLTSLNPSDIERIEVIKGPQSALFGRNTYAGAINIITKKPGDEFTGNFSVSMAEHDQFEISGGLGGPIVEGKLAGSVFLRHLEYGGEHTNQYDGKKVGDEETKAIAGSLRFTPNDSLEINARIVYDEIDDGALSIAHQPFRENNYAERAIEIAPGVPVDGDPVGGFDYFRGEIKDREVNSNNFLANLLGDAGIERDHIGGNISVEWDLNASLKLTSISGYDKFETTQYNETSTQPSGGVGLVPLGIFIGGPPSNLSEIFIASEVLQPTAEDLERTSFNQDLRLEYDNDGAFRGLVGASYYKQEIDFVDLFDQNILATPENDAAYNAAIGTSVDDAALQQITDICNRIPTCDPMAGAPTVLGMISLADFDNIVETLDSSTENWAVYGRVEWDITEQLTVGLGARYSEDTKKADVITKYPLDILDINDVLLYTIPAGGSIFSGDKTFTSFTPRLTVDYKLSDDSLLYGVVARGTKPGGFNTGTSAIGAGRTSFDEESITSFEIGSKNTFADGQIRFNVAAFFEQIEDYQLTTTVLDPSTGEPGTSIDNKGEVDVMGIEIETGYAPASIEGLGLRFNYAWVDSEFTKGTDGALGDIDDVLDDGIRNCSLGLDIPGQACIVGTTHNAAESSIKGRRLPLSAEHQISAGIDYTRPIGNSDTNWFIGTDVSYESEKFVQVLNLAEIPASTVVNFNTGIQGDGYRVALWGKNVFDEDAPASATRFISGEDLFRRAFQVFKRRGSQWGVTLSANF